MTHFNNYFNATIFVFSARPTEKTMYEVWLCVQVARGAPESRRDMCVFGIDSDYESLLCFARAASAYLIPFDSSAYSSRGNSFLLGRSDVPPIVAGGFAAGMTLRLFGRAQSQEAVGAAAASREIYKLPTCRYCLCSSLGRIDSM